MTFQLQAAARHYIAAAFHERDQATAESEIVKAQFREHLTNVELWMPQFPAYREAVPFLEQLRAGRGVPTAGRCSLTPGFCR